MWQRHFEKYRDMGFTVIGLALDVEGIEPAKLYYQKFGVTFPALVDPNYATEFGAVPKTFFVDEHGVVQELKDWEQRLKPVSKLKPVTDTIRQQWSKPGQRLAPESIAALVKRHESQNADLANAVELASRYLDLELKTEAAAVLQTTLKHYSPRQTARADDSRTTRLLGQAYLQLARASEGEPEARVKFATLSFYLNPTVGFGKQIARLIAPDKFDGRPRGDFDNVFREATLKRLRRERSLWLQQE